MHSLRIIYTDVPESAVGITNRNELDGPGIEPHWGRDVPYTSRPALGPPNLLYDGYRGFPMCQAARSCREPPNSTQC